MTGIATESAKTTSTFEEKKMNSYFGRVNYNYDRNTCFLQVFVMTVLLTLPPIISLLLFRVYLPDGICIVRLSLNPYRK